MTEETNMTDLKQAADQLGKLIKQRKATQAKLADLKAQEDALEEQILDALHAAKLEAFSTPKLTIAIKRTTFAELHDPDAFFAYVAKHKAFELLHRRCTVEAAREYWAAEKVIPGVRPGQREDLSVTARKPNRA
jgi:phage shock protein A